MALMQEMVDEYFAQSKAKGKRNLQEAVEIVVKRHDLNYNEVVEDLRKYFGVKLK